MKLSLCSLSISLVKDTLYTALSWLSGSKAPVRMYPKFKLNFSKISISKWITKIMRDNASFVKYCSVLIGGFEGDSALPVSTHSIFCFHILFTSCNILGWFWLPVIDRRVIFWSNYSRATFSAACGDWLSSVTASLDCFPSCHVSFFNIDQP